MKDETFRQFLERLRKEHELTDIRQPVDIRHIATLVDQSEQALFFHNVIGYDMPVVSGIIRTQRRAVLGMGVATYGEIEAKLEHGINHPIASRYVETRAAQASDTSRRRCRSLQSTGADVVDLRRRADDYRRGCDRQRP
jgi:2,5-furandicarboxylate decarboxylase 1